MLNIGHTTVTYGHLMSRNDQQPTCRNTASRNQTLTFRSAHNGTTVKKYNIQGDIRTLMQKECDVKKNNEVSQGKKIFE